MDVIFLAYANSQTDPLPSLAEEDDGVFSTLVNRALKGDFFIHRDAFTTLEKLNDYLGIYGERLAVFHYSGHADNDTLHLVGDQANAKGIAHQLGTSAKAGHLKMVLLNGCSTAGQVNGLLDAGVPVVVATSAPVGDKSAMAFSLRFYRSLSEKRLSIREAFEEALGPAQTATSADLNIVDMPRGVGLMNDTDVEDPLWGLYTLDPRLLEENPIPYRKVHTTKGQYVPNELLTDTLFETLYRAKNREIVNLYMAEEEGEYVELGEKQTTIVNVLPFPIATHLQKLLCPVEQENEGFDKVSLRRLEQTGLVFHATTEMMTYILLAQLWELRLNEEVGALPEWLAQELRTYFYLNSEERRAYDHLLLIKSLRSFLDSLNEGQGIHYFVQELSELRSLMQVDHPFSQACNFLTHLHQQAVAGKIAEADIPLFCQEGEEHLCHFFEELGFLHRYTLASVQDIDIERYRHQKKGQTVFNHKIVKLMRAFGRQEHLYYLLSDFLQNRGVVLLKGSIKVADARQRRFTAEQLEFLNLSPFVIDRNAFEVNTDLSNLLFFESCRAKGEVYFYKNVKRPESQRDRLEVQPDGPFAAVKIQLEAFRKTILNED
ncbi:MAG: CHAT domain-containing protein [Saprospiraceae bacterium]|nr:CHAT domain-containing protein [Lewinella sp.]